MRWTKSTKRRWRRWRWWKDGSKAAEVIKPWDEIDPVLIFCSLRADHSATPSPEYPPQRIGRSTCALIHDEMPRPPNEMPSSSIWKKPANDWLIDWLTLVASRMHTKVEKHRQQVGSRDQISATNSSRYLCLREILKSIRLCNKNGSFRGKFNWPSNNPLIWN